MLQYGTIENVSLEDGRSRIVITSEDPKLYEYVRSRHVHDVELRLDDGRIITAAQRRKAYAIIRDIALYTGYMPEEAKEVMKYDYICKTGRPYFSFSDCSIETARIFIKFLMEFCLRNGIQLRGMPIDKDDDDDYINTYLACCIIHRRCCICGKDGEVHHVDALGMGADRKTIDDSKHRIMCLCRKHHTLAHNTVREKFFNMYHVHGIVKESVPVIYGGMYEEIR